jgi:hypothetical protein
MVGSFPVDNVKRCAIFNGNKIIFKKKLLKKGVGSKNKTQWKSALFTRRRVEY